MFGGSKSLAVKILDNNFRYRFQYNCVYLALGVISLIMTVLNIITGQNFLTAVTGVFSLFCFIFLLISHKFNLSHIVMQVPFVIVVFCLFFYFLISGKPDGFSVLWICFLPTCGLLLFGRKSGTIYSAVMLAALIFFLWTPAGKSLLLYKYQSTFCTRFPFLFSAFYLVSLLLETVRVMTHSALQQTAENNKYLSTHDTLTGLKNRFGFQEALDKSKNTKSFLIMDLDHFKNINDKYGHLNGDVILKQVAERFCERLGSFGELCRWGGEEFAVLFSPQLNENELLKIADEMRSVISDTPFILDGASVQLTVSIGGASDIDKADAALYNAKKKGRNCVHIFKID